MTHNDIRKYSLSHVVQMLPIPVNRAYGYIDPGTYARALPTTL